MSTKESTPTIAKSGILAAPSSITVDLNPRPAMVTNLSLSAVSARYTTISVTEAASTLIPTAAALP